MRSAPRTRPTIGVSNSDNCANVRAHKFLAAALGISKTSGSRLRFVPTANRDRCPRVRSALCKLNATAAAPPPTSVVFTCNIDSGVPIRVAGRISMNCDCTIRSHDYSTLFSAEMQPLPIRKAASRFASRNSRMRVAKRLSMDWVMMASRSRHDQCAGQFPKAMVLGADERPTHTSRHPACPILQKTSDEPKSSAVNLTHEQGNMNVLLAVMAGT